MHNSKWNWGFNSVNNPNCMSALESSWWLLRSLVAKRPLAVEWCHGPAAPTIGQLQAALWQLGVGRRLVCGRELWGRTHRERSECDFCLHSVFCLILIIHFWSQGLFICRDGATPSTSLPSTPKIRNGIPASVADDGSGTGGTKPWTPGPRWVFFVFVFTPSTHQHLKPIFSPAPPLLYVSDRSPHSTQHFQIHSVTSAAAVGRSMRSPEVVCHFGPSPYRARCSHTHTAILA